MDKKIIPYQYIKKKTGSVSGVLARQIGKLLVKIFGSSLFGVKGHPIEGHSEQGDIRKNKIISICCIGKILNIIGGFHGKQRRAKFSDVH